MEVGLQRNVVKAADFYGKAAYVKIREREHQPAYLCTLTMEDDRDAQRACDASRWVLVRSLTLKRVRRLSTPKAVVLTRLVSSLDRLLAKTLP